MQKVYMTELKEMQGGHYHWVCKDNKNFTRAPYKTFAEAGAAADRHISKYPAHADVTSVVYCEKSSCYK